MVISCSWLVQIGRRLVAAARGPGTLMRRYPREASEAHHWRGPYLLGVVDRVERRPLAAVWEGPGHGRAVRALACSSSGRP
jgi:hypothetical protein